MNYPAIPKAKSGFGPDVTLEAHTALVIAAAERIAEAWNFDVSVARLAALVHDLGKAHPIFQAQIASADGFSFWDSGYESDTWSGLHRHEYSSICFTGILPEAIQKDVIECILCHHKPLIDATKEEKKAFGNLLDTEIDTGETFELHSREIEIWSRAACRVAQRLGFDFPDVISSEQAEKAWKAAEQCYKVWKKRQGWSRYRGLLMAADHFASAMRENTIPFVNKSFCTPDLTGFLPKATDDTTLYPLSAKEASSEKPHTLVVAPTGAGKTNFLMRRCAGRRIFYTLPFQASINAMFSRFQHALQGQDIRMQHAATAIVMRRELTEADYAQLYPLQGLPGAAVKVLTPHQLATLVFGLPGFESLLLDVKGQAIIMDEIHTYAGISQSLILHLIEILSAHGCRIHIGTATMPSELYQTIFNLLGGEKQVLETALLPSEIESYNRHHVNKLDAWDEAKPVILAFLEQGKKVLIVANTVRKAQQRFEEMLEIAAGYNHLLVHSRFRRADRAEKEAALRNEFDAKTEPCWVVSTQVVEVSLDISFDAMITDAAPLDALIQRFGRINRRRSHGNLGKLKPVYVIRPAGSQKPYESAIVQRSFDVLPENAPLKETELQTMLDFVYAEKPLDPVPIDVHVQWQKENCKLQPLCNKSASVLMDVLEFDGATCILASDREAYLAASWEKRPDMEIPVSISQIKPFRVRFEQLEVGAAPFVVPQPFEEYQKRGLSFEFETPDNVI
jgi:CRISPR-associated endonuclease/helicase Cas3